MRLFFRITLILTGSLSFAATNVVPALSEAIVRVIDGDTVAIAGGKSVRLVGFNAPDSGITAACAAERTLAPKATARVRQLIAGGADLRLVACSCPKGTEGTPFCNRGRACGILTVNGRNIGSILIAEGLAAPFNCGLTSCPPLPHPWCAAPR